MTRHKALLGQKELADLLGLSKQALYWRINHAQDVSIPQPDYRVSATRLWTYDTLRKAELVPESRLNDFVLRMNQMTIDDLTKSG